LPDLAAKAEAVFDENAGVFYYE